MIGKEPDIPMTYLLAQPLTSSGPPAYEKAFPRELAQFASRYDPGTVVKVDSVHYMEAAIPDRISSEIDKLLAGR